MSGSQGSQEDERQVGESGGSHDDKLQLLSKIVLEMEGCVGKSEVEKRPNEDVDSNRIMRASWTEEEDRLLAEAVEVYGKRWSLVSKQLQSRSKHQCRDRWRTRLDPRLDNFPPMMRPRRFSRALLDQRADRRHPQSSNEEKPDDSKDGLPPEPLSAESHVTTCRSDVFAPHRDSHNSSQDVLQNPDIAFRTWNPGQDSTMSRPGSDFRDPFLFRRSGLQRPLDLQQILSLDSHRLEAQELQRLEAQNRQHLEHLHRIEAQRIEAQRIEAQRMRLEAQRHRLDMHNLHDMHNLQRLDAQSFHFDAQRLDARTLSPGSTPPTPQALGLLGTPQHLMLPPSSTGPFSAVDAKFRVPSLQNDFSCSTGGLPAMQTSHNVLPSLSSVFPSMYR
mmetsp:Transcript_20728/g.49257  ORF Transcript_20728/g.49257 Transcript_20728/m.49257 type:complete len:389 (+) Transcript_20728:1-1167(+)